MGSKLKCRGCGSEIEASHGMLPDGWHYTKTEDELAAPRGKPTCRKCLPDFIPLKNFRIETRRKLYDD
jgi:hypothetical protein